MDRIGLVRERLTAALAPDALEVVDESHLHAGHAGARSGGGHFAVTIVSAKFRGENTVARHRMIYAALGDAMGDQVHALSISAHSPDEL